MKRYMYSTDPYEEPQSLAEEVDEFSETIEIDIDATIIVDSDGNWEYEDTEYPWAKNTYSKNGDWYSDNYSGVHISDVGGIVERIDDIIVDQIPMKSGEYKITGTAKLVFDISGIEHLSDYVQDEDGSYYDDGEDYTDDAEVDYNYKSSSVENFKCQPII